MTHQVLEHNVTKLGEKGSDHWAIHAQLTGFTWDRQEGNVYEAKNLGRLERILAERSQGVASRQRKSTVTAPGLEQQQVQQDISRHMPSNHP